MKLISSNVNGRVKGAARRQLEAILARSPDVIALQEVTAGNYVDWCEGLLASGYSIVSSVDLVGLPYPPPPYPSPPFPWDDGGEDHIRRRYFNLTAARHPTALLDGLSFPKPDEARFAFPEKYVAARVLVDGLEVDVHNAHLPPGVSRGEVKVHHFEAIQRRIGAGGPRILCGDFNAPAGEDDDGPLAEGAPKTSDEEPSRWTAAELSVVANPTMRDAYRDVHVPGEPFPVSHVTGTKNRTQRRYDYVFVSEHFATESCVYLTSWLRSDGPGGRLSDHAPIEAVLSPGA